MSNKNLDGKYGIRYGIFAPPLAEQVKEQGYRFPDKKTEDKFENANKAISTIHMAELITDEEWEKILDKFHNDLIRVVVEMKKEKKWRAFKISEAMTLLGTTLRFRRKNKEKEKGELYDGILSGILQKAPYDTIVTIGCYNGTLSDLFENYELYNFHARKWGPFGVEE